MDYLIAFTLNRVQKLIWEEKSSRVELGPQSCRMDIEDKQERALTTSGWSFAHIEDPTV